MLQQGSAPWLHEGSGAFEQKNNQWVFTATSQLKNPRLNNSPETFRDCTMALFKS
jgi:hypothetical protein